MTVRDVEISPADEEERSPRLDGNDPEMLEPALWQALQAASELSAFASAFVRLQSRFIPSARSVALFQPAEAAPRFVAAWPHRAEPSPQVLAIAQAVMAQRRTVIKNPGRSSATRLVGLPVEIDGELRAIQVFSAVAADGVEDKAALGHQVRQAQWGLAALREFLRGRSMLDMRTEQGRSRTTLDVMGAVADKDGFYPASLAAVTDLATRFACNRVSIGFSRNGSVRVATISHTSDFRRQMRLVQQVGAAMDEAVDQRARIVFPPSAEDSVVTTAHQDFAHEQRLTGVLSIPLFVADRFVGAMTFERNTGVAFTPDEIGVLDAVAGAVGPMLYEKRRNDRWIGAKLGESMLVQVKRLLGPGFVGRKLFAVATIAIVLLLTFITDVARVSGDALIEAQVRRVVVSAYDGYIQSASARPGDLVAAGDTLASLEDRELNLERMRWLSERRQHELEYDRALASREPASLNIMLSRIEQADAQIDVLDEQIARTQLLAPFDGLVVSGDLSQRVGGAVSRGEVLFELSPLTGYRLVMHVDERDVARVQAGQSGEAVFAAFPDIAFPLTVETITPVAEQRAGSNGFRIEASISGDLDRLRPGMTGVARVAVGEASLFSLWTRPAVDWLRLALWRWMP